MICLDTNAAIATLNQTDPRLRRRLEQAFVSGVMVGIPAIVLFELWYGVSKSSRQKANAAALERFLAMRVTPWPFEPADSVDAGDIRATLERQGKPIGPYDILIAAQARRRGAILVTANESEFVRVPGLRIENWSRG
jgi:tRNA(fMet)-specific endonuclease VapC